MKTGEVLAKFHRSFVAIIRSQLSTIALKSNILGDIGTSLNESKQHYQNGSYIYPIYNISWGAGRALYSLFSSALGSGFEYSRSGSFINFSDYFSYNTLF